MAYSAVCAAPFGALGIRLEDGQLVGLDFLPAGTDLKTSDILEICAVTAQLDAYFSNPAHCFTLPLRLAGTPFRQRVWAAIAAIPPGQTASYGEIARKLDSSARAVGQATGDNPIPIIIPCHRVLAAHGLGGFMHNAGDFSLGIKKWLLAHEGIAI